MNGILSIHKPKGPTSHDVVAKIRRLAGTRRVGHAGTLDPMAEGVLVCCLGRATRVVPWLTGLPKEYTGEMVLGAESNTYDAEGEIRPVRDPSDVTREAVENAFRSQTGFLAQAAPPFSAVKVRGKKLYEYARKGEDVPEKIRPVRVDRFDIVRFYPPRVLFIARVGSGTYIRSLAHEAGKVLGCGAYLSALCRTSVGSFSLEDSVSLEALEADPETVLLESLLPIPLALTHLPKVILLPQAEARLRHGAAFLAEDILEAGEIPPPGSPLLVLDRQGEAMAVVHAEAEGGPYKPLRVLVSDDGESL